jgi:hypothetical protein
VLVRWIAKPSIAIAADAVSVSIVRTRPSPSSAAAIPALWNVPDRLAARWSERIRSYPWSSE